MTKWKLVPVEPTPEMIKAGADVECIITGIDEIDAPEDYKRVFMAMLEAAPQPPKSEPIAYIEHHKGGDNLVWDNPGGKYSVLYTAPLVMKLSDERIFDLLKQVDPHAVRLPLGFKQFAIAIEREILGGSEK